MTQKRILSKKNSSEKFIRNLPQKLLKSITFNHWKNFA